MYATTASPTSSLSPSSARRKPTCVSGSAAKRGARPFAQSKPSARPRRIPFWNLWSPCMSALPAGQPRTFRLRLAIALLAIFASACESRSEACETNRDCFEGEQCLVQTCVPQDESDAGDTAPLDAGDTDTSDAGDADTSDTSDTSDTDTPDADIDVDAGDDHPHSVPVQVSVGLNHTCALLSDHTVWCWSSTGGRLLGLPDAMPRSETPVRVEGLEGARQVVSAFGQTCARFDDGTARCLGDSLDLGLG